MREIKHEIYCLRYYARECKRYEQGDSKRTIYFKRPSLENFQPFVSRGVSSERVICFVDPAGKDQKV